MKILFTSGMKELIEDVGVAVVMAQDCDYELVTEGNPERIEEAVATYKPDLVVLNYDALKTRNSWNLGVETAYCAGNAKELEAGAKYGIKTIGIAKDAGEILKKLGEKPYMQEGSSRQEERKKAPASTGQGQKRAETSRPAAVTIPKENEDFRDGREDRRERASSGSDSYRRRSANRGLPALDDDYDDNDLYGDIEKELSENFERTNERRDDDDDYSRRARADEDRDRRNRRDADDYGRRSRADDDDEDDRGSRRREDARRRRDDDDYARRSRDDDYDRRTRRDDDDRRDRRRVDEDEYDRRDRRDDDRRRSRDDDRRDRRDDDRRRRREDDDRRDHRNDDDRRDRRDDDDRRDHRGDERKTRNSGRRDNRETEDRVQEDFEKDLNGGGIKTKVITVCSAKGGVGKTTIACELATYLSLVDIGPRKLRICIIDCNIDFGDVKTTLGMEKETQSLTYWVHEIRSLVKEGAELKDITYTKKEMEEKLAKNKNSGLWVLPAPISNTDSMGISSDELRVILRNLRDYGEFDYIVCDTGNNTRDSTVVALEAADIILMIMTQNINTANCDISFIKTMEDIDFDISSTRIIINNILPKKITGISVDEIESYFSNYGSYKCVGKIRYNPDVMKATNIGEPLAFDPSNEFTKQMKEIVAYVLNDESLKEEPVPEKKGLFGFLKRKKKK